MTASHFGRLQALFIHRHITTMRREAHLLRVLLRDTYVEVSYCKLNFNVKTPMSRKQDLGKSGLSMNKASDPDSGGVRGVGRTLLSW